MAAFILGHVGDGNFHVVFVIDPDRPEELAEALNARLVACRRRGRGVEVADAELLGVAGQFQVQPLGPQVDRAAAGPSFGL